MDMLKTAEMTQNDVQQISRKSVCNGTKVIALELFVSSPPSWRQTLAECRSIEWANECCAEHSFRLSGTPDVDDVQDK